MERGALWHSGQRNGFQEVRGSKLRKFKIITFLLLFLLLSIIQFSFLLLDKKRHAGTT